MRVNLIAYFYFYSKKKNYVPLFSTITIILMYRDILRKNSLACDNSYYPKQSHEPSSKIYIERKHFPSQFRDSKSKERKKDPVCVSSRNILCPVSLLYSVHRITRILVYLNCREELNSETNHRGHPVDSGYIVGKKRMYK